MVLSQVGECMCVHYAIVYDGLRNTGNLCNPECTDHGELTI